MKLDRPLMGFNVWNTFGGNISDSLIREEADAMIDLGLRDAGYVYVDIDDCWSTQMRDHDTDTLVPDPEKFPNGIKPLADYLHSRGMKLGIYSDCGTRTCGNYPGSFEHEYLDAQTFASWGVDLLKYDYCYNPSKIKGEMLYRTMSMALKSTGRDIVFSICTGGRLHDETWARSAGAHMYRSTHDIYDNWQMMLDHYLSQTNLWGYSAPYCYNDLDMMTIGMYGKGANALGGCDYTQYQAQMALWCLHSCPLILGCDVRTLDEKTTALLTNKDLLRINQDSQCRPPMQLNPYEEGKHSIALAKHLDDGSYAVGVFNIRSDGKPTHCVVVFDDMGLTSNAGYDLQMRNIFTGEETVESSFLSCDLGPHECRMYIAKLVKR